MSEGIILSSPHKNFEDIKKVDKNGVEYWEARELMPLFGYEKWERFNDTIKRAMRSCANSGQNIDDHFPASGKMVKIGLDSVRKVVDYFLDRYACYLIAQNGDPNKPEIALAQTYFAIQTRKQEIFEQLSIDEKRLFIRNEVSDHNKKLMSTAKQAGVTKFGSFNSAGYKGLYGTTPENLLPEKHIKEVKKEVKKLKN